MSNNFRNIDYPKLLLEGLRHYFSINNSGDVSFLYKYLTAFVALFPSAFADLVAFRNKEALIAQCKFQIGQLTNLLNYFYDATLSRIYISQSVISVVADPMFQYAPVNFDSDFASAPLIEEREFGDRVNESLVTINVPTGVNISDLTATVEQIKLQGIPYQIITF